MVERIPNFHKAQRKKKTNNKAWPGSTEDTRVRRNEPSSSQP